MTVNEKRLAAVNKISNLSIQAINLTAHGKRDEEMTAKLIEALQLFKENRLSEAK
jgi:hypothetical protein